MANIFLIQDFVGVHAFLGVTWTLILEFFWYALFAIGLLVSPKRSADMLARAAPIVIALLTIISFVSGHRLPLARIGMIYAATAGMQTYRYYSDQIAPRRHSIDVGQFLVLMGISNTLSFGYYHHPNISFGEAFWPWLIAPMIFFAPTCVNWIRDSAVFQSKILAWFGAISLSIYLLHPFAMMICGRISIDLLRVAVTFALSLVMATIAYCAIERPGIAWEKSWPIIKAVGWQPRPCRLQEGRIWIWSIRAD